jgi:P-type conjugative transfer protein TrbJ
MDRMKVAGVVLLLGFGAAGISPAHAQFGGAVYCTNCSTSLQQVTQLAHEVTSLTNQTTSLANQALSLKYQAQNLARMPENTFNNFNGDTGALNNILNSGNLLNGQVNGVLSRIQSGSYPTGNYNALMAQLQQARTQQAANVQNLQQLVQTQRDEVQTDSGAITAIQGAAQQTQGTQQALNVSNEFAANENAELLKINQTQLAIAQSMATQNTLANDRQASMDAQAQAMLHDPATVSTTDGDTL